MFYFLKLAYSPKSPSSQPLTATSLPTIRPPGQLTYPERNLSAE